MAYRYPSYQILTTHLWDLRAHAESKLRYLTRAQQHLSAFESEAHPHKRAELRRDIVKGLHEIAAITETMRAVARDALAAAQQLPT
jgi:hypothetical protein